MLLILPLAASLAGAAEPLRVYFTGKSQDFHQAQESLTDLAAELSERYDARVTVTPAAKSPDFPALDEADVLVLCVRHTAPPTNVLQRVKDWFSDLADNTQVLLTGTDGGRVACGERLARGKSARGSVCRAG